MPSYLDIAVIAVVLISALLSMVRGFTREILAIGSWAAAAVAAYLLYPHLMPYVQPHIAKEVIAKGVSAGAIFFVTLIIVSVITVKISDAILDSKVGALDRTLGLLFGAARGFFLCVVGFLFFMWLATDKQQQPEWIKNAKTKPFLEMAGEKLQAVLPDPAVIFDKFKKTKLPGDDTPAEPDPTAPPQKAPAAPAAPVAPAPPALAPAAPVAPAPVPAPAPGAPPAPGNPPKKT